MRRFVPIVLSCLLIACVGCPANKPVPAPTGYATYKSTDNKRTFKCDYPEGWSASGGGKQNAWAKFISGSAKIEARTDITGSLMGDIAKNAPLGFGEDMAFEEDLEPVAQVHRMGLEIAESAFSNYKEIAEAEKFKCNIGPARRSEFTSSSFGGPLHGYRATLLQLDRRVTVYCTCSESDWATLEPAFDRVLKSFAPH